MRIRTKAVLLGLLAAAVLPGSAFAAAPRSVVANLDDDRRWERLRIDGTEAEGQRLVLIDRCRGELVTRPLTRRWDSFWHLEVRELDGATARLEIFIAATRGTTGGDQLWKVVRQRGAGCAETRTLFMFRNATAAEPPGYDLVESQVSRANYRTSVRGTELRVLELLWQPGDGCPACASHSRRLYFDYRPSLGRYKRYDTGPIEGPPG